MENRTKMTQEEKQLLLQDLCARLPYGVICFAKYERENEIDHEYYMQEVTDELFSISKNNTVIIGSQLCSLENCKPYLRPMSSMTEEEYEIYHELIGGMFGTGILINLPILEDFLNKNMFDYRGLIEKGLALEASEDIYI